MRKLADVCIHRPVFATMLILAMVVAGAVGYRFLAVDRYPAYDLPTVTVRTELPGGAPEEVEVAVTYPIEEIVNTVEGIRELRSISGAGTSLVLVTFDLGRDIDAAAQDVLVVANPEPTSITDAYAIIKILYRDHGVKRFQLIVNSVRTPKAAVDVYRNITTVADRYLPGVSIEFLGHVLYDELVSRAIIERKLLVEGHPESPAALCVKSLVDRLVEEAGTRTLTGNMQFFWKRLLQPEAAV